MPVDTIDCDDLGTMEVTATPRPLKAPRQRRTPSSKLSLSKGRATLQTLSARKVAPGKRVCVHASSIGGRRRPATIVHRPTVQNTGGPINLDVDGDEVSSDDVAITDVALRAGCSVQRRLSSETPDSPVEHIPVPSVQGVQMMQLFLLKKIYLQAIKECADVARFFYIRRMTRRKALKRLAEDCVKFGPKVRSKAAELRAAAAKKRLELLRSGDMEGYAQLVGKVKEGRVREILDETERIVQELGAPLLDETQEIEQPQGLRNGKMMPHQLQGLRWLVSLVENQASGILADDMGLGKTIQVLALLTYLKERLDVNGPHLIIVPASLQSHWVDEIVGWLPTFSFTIFRGLKSIEALDFNEGIIGQWDKLNAVITTYDHVIAHQVLMSRLSWCCTIIDEGHRLKNHNTVFSQACRNLRSRHRILLTGTPVQNSLRELWSMMAFVAPQAFGSLDDFEQWFSLPPIPTMKLTGGPEEEEDDDVQVVSPTASAKKPSSSSVSKILSEEDELLIIQRLHRVLRPFILRRTKAQVLTQLPPKREEVIWIPMSAWQRTLYRSGLQHVRANVEIHGNRGLTMANMVLLRKALNHPYHFVDPEKPCALTEKKDNLFRCSGKFEFLQRVVPRLRRSGHKVLIFAQMTHLLDMIAELLKELGIVYMHVDGRVNFFKRKCTVDRFKHDPELGVLLLSTRAGNVGLNLQAADTVILFDSDWNPQVDLQAMDRVHRIGQTRPVLIIRLMTPSSLDFGLLRRAGNKLEIERKVIGAGDFHQHRRLIDSKDPSEARQKDALLRDLVREARQKGAVPTQLPVVDLTTLEETNRKLSRSPEEHEAWDAEDLALLGPVAAGDTGAGEDVTARLERCGRLITADEVPRGGLANLPTSATRMKGARPLKKKVRRTWDV